MAVRFNHERGQKSKFNFLAFPLLWTTTPFRKKLIDIENIVIGDRIGNPKMCFSLSNKMCILQALNCPSR